jgi:hypothetical protein
VNAHTILQTAGIRVPKFYIPMLIFRVVSAFPKGMYGVVAFVLFEGVLLAQVAKTYFEYLPTCPVIPTAPS